MMSLCFGLDAAKKLERPIPRVAPEEIKLPDISGGTSMKLNKKKEYLQFHTITTNHFKLKKMKKADERETIFTKYQGEDDIYSANGCGRDYGRYFDQ